MIELVDETERPRAAGYEQVLAGLLTGSGDARRG
jgi:hypothetical protein